MFVMKIFFALLLFLFTNSAFAQQQNCNCSQSLKSLIAKVEKEYPGFAEKTNDTLLYNNLKANLQKETATLSDEKCLAVLQEYVAYFKDRHIWLLPNQQPQTAVKATNTESLIFNIELNKFKKDISKSTDQLEGIWKNDAYEIGIKRIKPNEYVGFIISADPKYWQPKEIKLKLFGDSTYEYKMQDHTVQKGKFTYDEKGLLYFKEILTELVKQTPNTKLSAAEITVKVNELNGFYVKRLTTKTTILKLANFSYPFVAPIENLLANYSNVLQNSENLIIDLRGNGGGTTDAFEKLLPYILTNPTRHIGAEHLSTPNFITQLKKYNATLVDNEINRPQIIEIEKRIKLLEANPGKFVNFSNSAVVTDTVMLMSRSPKQIVILVDNKVASSAEALLLIAKQSKKVKVMGTPTSGVLDYANAYFFDDFACKNYKLLMPTFRSLRIPEYPIDNIGIQPDIYLDKNIKDWIAYSIEYLEN